MAGVIFSRTKSFKVVLFGGKNGDTLRGDPDFPICTRCKQEGLTFYSPIRNISRNPFIIGANLPEEIIGEYPDIAALLDDTLNTEELLFYAPTPISSIEDTAIGADPDLSTGI